MPPRSMSNLPGKRLRSTSNETSQRPTKKKNGGASFAGQIVVDVILDGNEDKPFSVHANILSAYSSEFKEKLEGLDGETKPLKTGDISFESFESFVIWVYAVHGGASIYESIDVARIDEASADATSDIDGDDENKKPDDENDDGESDAEVVENGSTANREDDGDKSERASPSSRNCIRKALNGRKNEVTDGTSEEATSNGEQGFHDIRRDANTPNDTALNAKSKVFLRLVDLYILGARLEALAFMRAVTLTLQRLIEEWETTPCPTVTKHALDHLRLTAPLCRYLTLCYAYYDDIPKSRFATLPSDFLTEVLDLTLRRAEDDDDVARTSEKWCDFHDHEDKAEVEECQTNRKGDRDVWIKRQKMKPRRSFVRFGGCC